MKYLAEMQAMSWEENPSDSEKTAKAAVKYIKEKKPGYVGIIFAEPDYTGHGAGHDTPEYYAQLKKLDNYIGEIIQAVEDAGMTVKQFLSSRQTMEVLIKDMAVSQWKKWKPHSLFPGKELKRIMKSNKA